MKGFTTAGLLALAGTSYAFPLEALETLQNDPEMVEMFDRSNDPTDAASKIFEPLPIFNKKTQYVDTTDSGPNPWVAPGPGDLRGPCPGLNAFANHGFLPHNGYATISQFFDATMNVVGMGPGLASFLAVYGATIDGDGNAWSIGGTPPDSITKGVGGQKGNGISGSHNKYESDASPMRPDLYEFGNDYKLRLEQFKRLLAMQPHDATANFDIPVLTDFRSKRFDTQIKHNPFFFNGPFTGVLVQPAAYTFIYRFMANHSASFTEGRLDRHVLQSWFSVKGSRDNLKWVPGHERIPMDWYRRPLLYPYDQAYFFGDVTNAAKKYPKFLDIGGNTGKKDSFTGVNVADFTGGAFNSKNLGKGNNFACLAYQFSANAKPDVTGMATTKLEKNIEKNLAKFGCGKLAKFDEKQLNQFPGYKRSQKGN